MKVCNTLLIYKENKKENKNSKILKNALSEEIFEEKFFRELKFQKLRISKRKCSRINIRRQISRGSFSRFWYLFLF